VNKLRLLYFLIWAKSTAVSYKAVLCGRILWLFLRQRCSFEKTKSPSDDELFVLTNLHEVIQPRETW